MSANLLLGCQAACYVSRRYDESESSMSILRPYDTVPSSFVRLISCPRSAFQHAIQLSCQHDVHLI